MRFAVLRLEAPLMSFGDVAVDESRPTDVLPGASMITGILANAMGYKFRETDRLQELQDRLVFGARLDRRGELLRDYQNARLEKTDKLWQTGPYGPSERAGGAGSYIGPVQRQRYYRADSCVTVALSLVDDQKPGLDDAVSALVEPFRPLFLGRVCCPPAGPIYQEETMEADSVHQVLSRTPLMSRSDRDVDAYVAEWPAEPSIAVEQEGLQLKKRYDLRDWSNNVHAGSRYVVRGRVTPPRP